MGKFFFLQIQHIACITKYQIQLHVFFFRNLSGFSFHTHVSLKTTSLLWSRIFIDVLMYTVYT